MSGLMLPPSSKRSSDVILESSKGKRHKSDLSFEVGKAAERILEDITEIRKETLPALKEDGFRTTDVVGAISNMSVVAKAASTEEKLDRIYWALLETKVVIPNDYPSWAKARLTILEVAYERLATKYKLLLESLPAPSDFGKPGVWQTAQDSDAAILCHRPVGKSGVPMCALHDVFRNFLVRLRTDTDFSRLRASTTDDEIVARSIYAATMLCNEMGNAFKNEKDRTAKFNLCIRELLPGVEGEYQFDPERDLSSCRVDAAWFARALNASEDKLPVCLREDKREPGETGDDVYMQVARSYTLAAKTLFDDPSSMKERYVKRGAPMFLLCLLGTHLSVQGGFYDGEHYMVEPLSEMYSMLPDATQGRQDKLARLLYAVAKGVDELKELAGSTVTPPSFPPATPRIYSSCTLYAKERSNGTLTFKAPLAAPHNNHTLFTATLTTTSASENLSEPEQIPVVVKLVSGPYGEAVHRFLAEKRFAPTLHGFVRLEGAPVAYVMDHLDGDWVCLFDLLKRGSSAPFHQAIWNSLKQVRELLDEKGFVHGDLRSSNIMVRIVDGKPEVKVIDFDWAGEAGKVRYPAVRNETIGWPGKAYGLIIAGHDRELLASWWSRETFPQADH
ncbi:hypothetical protein WOLCODRAFT_168126 [Wolfiporia cocos MD-104 SS10]|uniref:Aminoglycoside phosphotransferase domain-containing protein n=1 Tax=Wolfiporia cocos (strain MD-104) TaxID=742152 RepID=A0A2H3J5Q0_WOLCO|nr:hypothetical protein WOLCODRAFT_168126 [Wolfiporia cocos MD-104 SS10]